MFVAGWETYIEELVRNFFDVTANPLNPQFYAVHSLAKNAAERSLKQFNTPNADNSRNLLVQYTGYDPINDCDRLTPTGRGLERGHALMSIRHFQKRM